MKSFIKESILYSTGQVLTRLASFLLVPFFTHFFSPEQTGQIYLFYSSLAFLNILTNHGLDAALFKFVGSSKWNQNDVVKSLLIYQIAYLTVFYIVFLVFSEPIAQLIFGNTKNYWIYILGSVLVCDSISQRGMVLLRLNSSPYLYILISLGNILLTLISVYYYVIKSGYEVLGVFHGIFFASFIQAIIIFILVYTPRLKGEFSINIIKSLVKFGFPFLPAGILFLITELSDRYFILWFLGESQVGFYSIAYKIGSIPLILISGINLAWQPFYVKRQNDENSRRLFGEIGSVVLFGFILLLTLLSIWIPLIKNFEIINDKYYQSLNLIPIIFISYLFYTWYILLMPSIILNNKQNWSPVFRGTAAVINICLNIILIPVYGLYGAAFSTLFAYFIMGLFLYFKNKTWMNIPVKYIQLILFLILSCTLYGLSLYSTTLIKLVFSTIYLILSFFVLNNILSISELKQKILK